MTIRPNAMLRAIGCAGLLLSAAPLALADTELSAGWEGSSSRGYGFVAPTLSFAASGSWSWIAGASLSYLYYEFPDAGGVTRVRSPGEAIGVGLRYAGPRLTLAFGPGYEIRQTTRRIGGGSKVDDDENGFTLQGSAFFQATPRTQLSAILSYGDANEYFWGRVGVKRQLTNFDYSGPVALHAGVELTSEGNDDSDANQLGGVFEVAFPQSRASLQFRAGRSAIEYPDGSDESKNVFGVAFYQGF